MSQESKKGIKRRTNSPAYLFLQLVLYFQVVDRGTSPGKATIFHERPCGRFIDIKSNLKDSRIQGSNFLGGIFNHRGKVRTSFKVRRERQPQQLKK